MTDSTNTNQTPTAPTQATQSPADHAQNASSSSQLSSGKPNGKSIYLVASLVGWMLVGGALIYLAPVLANRLFHSDTTEIWMETLTRGGYNPMISVVGGGIALVATITGHVIWSPKFGQTR